MAQQNIKLGQTTIEQVKKIDDNFTELYNADSAFDERLDTNETAVSGIDTRLKTVESNYITKAVNNLENYYTKTQTDTKLDTLQNQISQIPKFAITVVETLPTENISSTTIYLLKTSSTETGNLYTEYIYVNNKWEELGTQKLDLSDYAKKNGYNEFSGANVFRGAVAIGNETGLDFTDKNDDDLNTTKSLFCVDGDLWWGDSPLVTQDYIDDTFDSTKHSQKDLSITNENLNSLYGEEYVGWYYADYGNTCANKPAGVGGFYLEVGLIRKTTTATYQILIDENGQYFRTQGAGGWTNWKKIAFTSDINNGTLTIKKGGTQVGTFSANQSTDTTVNIDDTKHGQTSLASGTDLNTLTGPTNVGWYTATGGSSCTNIPTDIGTQGFALEVFIAGGYTVQKLTPYNSDTMFIRRVAPAVSSWVEFATKNDIPTKIVSGVKGDAETTYRTGDVNITKSNIGLGNVDNVKQYSESNPNFSTTAPKMDGTANAGTSTNYARADHIHPTDTSRASTAVATTTSNGLMSKTDKNILNILAANGDDAYLYTIKIAISSTSSDWETKVENGTTYYIYPLNTTGTYTASIVSAYNEGGYDIVYQPYRSGSTLYIMVANKMNLTTTIVRNMSGI